MTDGSLPDDIIDERIRSLAAREFNAPEGAPPRDAMWREISAARRAARAAAAAVATHTQAEREADVLPMAARRTSARPAAWRWGAALAAGLIIGIAVDRVLVDRGAPSSTRVADRATATPVREPAGVSAESTARGSTRSEVADVGEVGTGSRPSQSTRVAQRAAAVPGASGVATLRTTPPDSSARALYRLAASQTLVQAEALLTAYRQAAEGTRDPQAMQQAARWARDVLSSTRLLLDSPAGADPQMRMLFTDLELILAQIVQLSGTPLQANERELIERAMRERDLLPRLRSMVPAGLAAS